MHNNTFTAVDTSCSNGSRCDPTQPSIAKKRWVHSKYYSIRIVAGSSENGEGRKRGKKNKTQRKQENTKGETKKDNVDATRASFCK